MRGSFVVVDLLDDLMSPVRNAELSMPISKADIRL
jgi:hypothetical protein